jgi:hypothetical protein
LDAPWTRIEREYLASLLEEFPDASIWELTERHNDRFMGKDFAQGTGFGFANLSTGRTVESVRYEYTTYKPLYDRGEAPEMVRYRNDQSVEAKAVRASRRADNAFGPPSRELEKAHDQENASAEDDGEDEACSGDNEEVDDKNEDGAERKTPQKKTSKKNAKTNAPKRRAPTKKKKKSEVTVEPGKEKEARTPGKGKRRAEDPKDDQRSTDAAKTSMTDSEAVEVDPFSKQAQLAEEDEMLLELAGAYIPENVPLSPTRSMSPTSLASSGLSPIPPSVLSPVPSNL